MLPDKAIIVFKDPSEVQTFKQYILSIDPQYVENIENLDRIYFDEEGGTIRIGFSSMLGKPLKTRRLFTGEVELYRDSLNDPYSQHWFNWDEPQFNLCSLDEFIALCDGSEEQNIDFTNIPEGLL